MPLHNRLRLIGKKIRTRLAGPKALLTSCAQPDKVSSLLGDFLIVNPADRRIKTVLLQ
jgi:hypothetical protein